MSKRTPKNRPASIQQRLINGARARGEDANFALQRYAAERFLYRLGESAHREHFVLKGATLFALWGGSLYRPTRDLDFTGYGSSEPNAVLDRFREICAVVVVEDGVVFEAATLRTEPIREETDYGGVRFLFEARLGAARVQMQVDVGFGNAIEPPAEDVEYPRLMDAPSPNVRAYPQEAVVAEKFHAMVVLGERNTRLKDFYDLHVLARNFPFDGDRIARAIKATFARRRTPIEVSLPVALAPRFFTDGQRGQQWRAYLTRNSLPGALADFGAVGELLQSFLQPVWSALAANEDFLGLWPQSGPWTMGTNEPEGVR